jgi:hypothetical protein
MANNSVGEKENKKINDVDAGQRQSYYRRQFEGDGVYNALFPDKYQVELDSDHQSEVLRTEVIRLLLAKQVIAGGLDIALEDLHEVLDGEMRDYDFPSGVNGVSQLFYDNDVQFEKNYLGYLKFLRQNYFQFPFYFQKTPTIRFQCPNAKNSHHYPRYHTDIGYGHPPQEINIWLPLTRPCGEQRHGLRLMNMENTRKRLDRFDYDFPMFIDAAINEKNFSDECDTDADKVETAFGKTLAFDARCLHTGEALRAHTRVSMDIRIIPVEAYEALEYRFQGAGRMKILYEPGECYHLLTVNDL